MLSLIIIDDQPNVLRGIEEIVKWEELGITVVATAINGRDGLEKIKAHHPDIVLTDIQMPVMDGICMMKELAKSEESPELIVLSGYSEFEYAKQAMAYGVSEYLLKPVLPAAIEETLRKVAARRNQKKRIQEEQTFMKEQLMINMPVLTENFVNSLLLGSFDSLQKTMELGKYFGVNLEASLFRVMCVEIDDYDNFLKDLSEDERQGTKLSIISHLTTSLTIGKAHITFSGGRAWGILRDEPDNEALLSKLEDLVKEVLLYYKTSITLGVGDNVTCVSKIPESYVQANESLKYKFYFGEGKIIFFNDLVYTQRVTAVLEFFNREKLIDGIKLRSKTRTLSCVQDGFALMREHSYLSDEYLKVIVHEIIATALSSVYSMGERLPEELQSSEKRWRIIERQKTLDHLEAKTLEIFQEIFDNISQMDNNRSNRIMEQMREYIHTNYSKDISLTNLSKILFITPNYLGSIFVKNMGKSFNDYLTVFRIEKAKELLKQTDCRVYEVAEMVGYNSLDYFGRVFKRFTGQSPTEYSGRKK